MSTTTSLSFSTDHRLINFNVPKYLINNFDKLVKFKRVSRTSMLIHLMENYIRTEHQMMERDNTLNEMMSDLSERNKKVIKNELIGLKRDIDEELEPPMIPYTNESRSWDEHFEEDQNDLSGVGWLNRLGR